MELFLIGATLALSINLELGVVNVTVVRTAIERGALPAFLIGLGSCIGDVVWACAGALGVSALLSWPPAAWILWLGGSGVLCWFAAAGLRETPPADALAALDAELARLIAFYESEAGRRLVAALPRVVEGMEGWVASEAMQRVFLSAMKEL